MKIVLVGPGGSGKDVLKKLFEKKGFKPEIIYTTRPKRDYEVQGEDYYFESDENFDYLQHDEFRDVNVYNEGKWRYGNSIDEWNQKNLFVLSPAGVQKLGELRKDCIVIYLNIADEIRSSRMSLRKDADDVARRIKTDTEDFKDFTDWDFQITNEQDVINLVLHKELLH